MSELSESDDVVVLLGGADDEARLDQGLFVRLDLPRPLVSASGAPYQTVLVGKTRQGYRAYANQCRHQAIPLDARGGTSLGVMSEDKAHLLCDSHGALYELTDGRCVSGPCEGTTLESMPVARSGATITLRIRRDRAARLT